MIPISLFGRLNWLAKEKKMFWGIKKNSWEAFYHVEVSSHNFDSRPSFHKDVDYIDDALKDMVAFLEKSE